MVEVRNQPDPHLRKRIRKQNQAAVIPVGSIEQHGPHLPVSTDSDIISEIAKRVSHKCNFLLLPTLSYGVSFEHTPFFNLSIKGSTLEKLLVDLCVSLSSNNINTIFILNGHYGNHKALERLNKRLKRILPARTRAFVFSYWNFMKRRFDHAGFVETSLMLAISKQVKMNQAQMGLQTENLSQKEKARLSKLASKSFPAATGNGVWGDPTNATLKDGKQMLSEIVRNVVKKSQTCLTDKKRKLHQ